MIGSRQKIDEQHPFLAAGVQPDKVSETEFNINCLLRDRVLIVPVDPISTAEFDRYVAALRQFDSVYLGNMNHRKQTHFELFHPGHVVFEYTTSYYKDHAHLEDFHIHKQIVGVIGIMTCDTLRESYTRFTSHIQKYQNCLVHRCFAFESASTTDSGEVKGPIIIPKENISFYLNTMISDFTSELIASLENLAGILMPLAHTHLLLLSRYRKAESDQQPNDYVPVYFYRLDYFSNRDPAKATVECTAFGADRGTSSASGGTQSFGSFKVVECGKEQKEDSSSCSKADC